MAKAIGNDKRCSTCRVTKTLADFHKSKAMPDGLHNQCRLCISAAGKAWRKANADKKAASNRRYRPVKYGVTPEEYDRMLAEQGGKCAICRQECKTRSHLCIDHDHATGVVRGLLCNACNVALGILRDDVARLEAAIRYLSR